MKDAAFIVEQHRERYDGKGYPNGLKAGKGTQFNPEVVEIFIEVFESNQFDWK